MRCMALPAAAVLLIGAAPTSPADQIRGALDASAAGWNAGSFDRFVAIYAADATYVGTAGLLNGKAAITERFRASFTGGDVGRGKLSFQPLAFRALSPVHQILWARWTVTSSAPGAAAETGLATLVFERRADGWKIISDTRS